MPSLLDSPAALCTLSRKIGSSSMEKYPVIVFCNGFTDVSMVYDQRAHSRALLGLRNQSIYNHMFFLTIPSPPLPPSPHTNICRPCPHPNLTADHQILNSFATPRSRATNPDPNSDDMHKWSRQASSVGIHVLADIDSYTRIVNPTPEY